MVYSFAGYLVSSSRIRPSFFSLHTPEINITHSSAAIFEAAHAIRPYLSKLLDAELAIKIDQKLADLPAQADNGQPVDNLILELLASQEPTREWMWLRLSQQQSETLRTWTPGADQRAADQRAAEQRAADQRAAEQRAADQRAAEQRAADQRAADQRAADQRADDHDPVKNDTEEHDASLIDCYVHAEMDDHVIVQRVTTVEVIISEDMIEFVSSATSKSEKVQIDALKSLIVHVIPKVNFESVGESHVEIESLNIETPQHLYFDLRPTHLGEGEVWVVFRQSQLPLLTLALVPQIVASKAQIPQRLSANGSIQNIPKLSEPLHQLRIIERRNGTQITYDYELDSPALNILGRYESKPITSDRQQYVETLYREIESRWYSSQEDVEAFAAELRGFGGQLLDELFPEALQRQLWEHRRTSKASW
ncbi:DUF7363 domain-containing protein [Nodosilinea sp. AN01ver1]|uniref:DUF7363 domain-containing protein n=1 Tax=Nodosilinea sp. AN01ver1 TaxID=3423362 RepID=UPI003D3206CA